MKPKILAVGLDIGHSAMKISWATSEQKAVHNDIVVPTFVTRKIDLSSRETRTKAEVETVELNGKGFFYGHTAEIQGNHRGHSGQEIDWYFSEVHDVLLIGGWQQVCKSLQEQGEEIPDEICIFLGLPAARFLVDKENLEKRARALLEPRIGEGKKLCIFVKSQAEAPLYWKVFTPEGEITQERNLSELSYGIIEIGHYTTDVTLYTNGMVRENSTDSVYGANALHVAIESFLKNNGYSHKPRDVSTALIEGFVKHYGKQVDVREIVEAEKEKFAEGLLTEILPKFSEHAATLDGIIVGGGGTQFVIDVFRKKYNHIELIGPERPRMCVSEGLLRAALYTGSKDQTWQR